MIAAFFVFILGASVGSFLSVVLHRAKTGESFCRGRSKCPFCRHVLGVLDLIPIVGWVVNMGRCRYCRKPVSWQYPALEVSLGAVFTLAYWVRRPSVVALDGVAIIDLAAVFALLSFFALIFVYDARHGEVPDSFSIGAIAMGLLAALVIGPYGFWKYLLGAAVGAGFFAAQYYLSGKKWVGSGDILIGAAMGAAVGIWGLFTALFLAYNAGLVATVFLLVAKRKSMKSTIPLGPFLALGTAAVLIFKLGGRIFGIYG